jgi:hypothetical protein
MTLSRLDVSIRAEGSHSVAVADIVKGEWRKVHVQRASHPPRRHRRERPDTSIDFTNHIQHTTLEAMK